MISVGKDDGKWVPSCMPKLNLTLTISVSFIHVFEPFMERYKKTTCI